MHCSQACRSDEKGSGNKVDRGEEIGEDRFCYNVDKVLAQNLKLYPCCNSGLLYEIATKTSVSPQEQGINTNSFYGWHISSRSTRCAVSRPQSELTPGNVSLLVGLDPNFARLRTQSVLALTTVGICLVFDRIQDQTRGCLKPNLLGPRVSV